MSPAARRRIAVAQRARWAKQKAIHAEPKKAKHWTQRPENKARLRKHMRKMSQMRLAA